MSGTLIKLSPRKHISIGPGLLESIQIETMATPWRAIFGHKSQPQRFLNLML